MSAVPADRGRIIASYGNGIFAVCRFASMFTENDWSAQTPCTDWLACDIAGHLRCVAENYHEYLDDAPNSRLARLMAQDVEPDQISRQHARQNAAELVALPMTSSERNIVAFAKSAYAYADRLPAAWQLPHYRYRDHSCTVGDYAGVACIEWHVHAWDLARTIGHDYRPADAELLVDAWRQGLPHLPIDPVDGGDPWKSVLVAFGRSPS